MKQLSFISAMVILGSVSCFGQNTLLTKPNYPLDIQLGIIDFKVIKDTLIIEDNDAIKFIKMGGKLYEIKRTTSLEEVKPEHCPKYWERPIFKIEW